MAVMSPRPTKKAAHSYADTTRGPRLQKVLAEAGVASRRACEELIEDGHVAVNGELVSALPAWVDPEQDRITVGDRVIGRSRRNIYVMLFKPRGTVSTNRDPEGRRRAIDLVNHPDKPRLFPVGRLDAESSGLLLLTNDGELSNRLTHPRYGIHKGYEVSVGGRLEQEDIARLEQGIFLTGRDRTGGKRTSRSKLSIIKRDRDRTLLFMELREGRNRQIRRMLANLGYPVKKLRRVRMGPLALKGLSPGEWRELSRGELTALRRAAYRVRDRVSRDEPDSRGHKAGSGRIKPTGV
jgi:23S rRNA pseudouridine2605 synthase